MRPKSAAGVGSKGRRVTTQNPRDMLRCRTCSLEVAGWTLVREVGWSAALVTWVPWSAGPLVMVSSPTSLERAKRRQTKMGVGA